MSLNNNSFKRTNLYAPSDASIAFILALLVPQILIVIVFAVLGKEIASSSLVSALVPQISFFGVFIFVSERRKVNYQKANQINFKINPLVLLLVVVIGIVALLGFIKFTNLIDYVTYKLGYHTTATSIDVSTFWKFFASVFYVALLPAICEELLFRGIITNGFKKYGAMVAISLSAVLFALMHQNLQQLFYQLFLGAVMAFVVIKTGSIIYTMCLHFINNFVILLNGYLSGGSGVDYSDPYYAEYYSNAWNTIFPILLMILSVAVIIGLLFLINYIVKKKSNQENIAKEEQKEGTIKEPTKDNQQMTQSKSSQILAHISKALDDADKHEKFYQNPFAISAIVVGLIFWILTIVSFF